MIREAGLGSDGLQMSFWLAADELLVTFQLFLKNVDTFFWVNRMELERGSSHLTISGISWSNMKGPES